MEIQWFGTAGFSIKTLDGVFLIDPYLTRNKNASPIQELKPADIKNASQIFISHGHFDHIQDVPQIAKSTDATVFCSDIAANSLEKSGLPANQVVRILSDKWEKKFSFFKAQSFYSHHVKFDTKLLLSTLLKINIQIPKYLPYFKAFPCGQVLSWRFFVEGKTLHFFGSAGASLNELKKLAGQPLDVLLLPLQGHSDICNIAVDYVKILQPQIVVPHHQDNFFPPISRNVEIQPFVQRVNQECPKTQIKILQVNETLKL